MATPHSMPSALPRALCKQSAGRDGPQTPEPFTDAQDVSLPSPPRPRFKLKRRNVPHLAAPTQQFLASVAAADVPIPSIEEPEIASLDSDMIDIYPGMSNFPADEDMALLAIRGRTFSPPKTPAPDVVPSLSPSRYPNWTIDSSFASSAESSPEPSRPSTARSTQTSSSLFSGLSQFSDDSNCVSPETDASDKRLCMSSDDVLGVQPCTSAPIKWQSRKAPWTQAMSAHLWSTYILYLQDPKVTPFRIGKSCVPPHGVCLRVAREARRSWKGAKGLDKGAALVSSGGKSGSSTPTAENSGTYMEWPHTCAATRGHLRDLCKRKASTPGIRTMQHMSRSPTPFTQAASRHWNRRPTPAGLDTAFGTRDMALSLTTSTSDAMQPQGLLAQLTSSSPRIPPASPPTRSWLFGDDDAEPSMAERRRLGSPFTAKSYGPSSSAPLAAALGLDNTRQPHTVGPRRTLQSPVRLSRSGTQKRRSRQGHEARKRPSLASDIFLDPSITATDAPSEPGLRPAFSSTSSTRTDELFIPRSQAGVLPSSSTAPQLSTSTLAPPQLPPPRLGSPFRGHGHSSSFSFPNRFTQPVTLDIEALGRPFATVRQPPARAESTSPPLRTNLASRLAYIDERLKEFRSRDITRRRSESPL